MLRFIRILRRKRVENFVEDDHRGVSSVEIRRSF